MTALKADGLQQHCTATSKWYCQKHESMKHMEAWTQPAWTQKLRLLVVQCLNATALPLTTSTL